MLDSSDVGSVNCIRVFSNTNTWIDFVIIPWNDDDFTKTEEIVSKAYDDWWELPDAECEPIADWVCRYLTESNIKFDIYFRNEEEDE
nr:MAG TPA: hypothetical protein [Caudoviricetes sp.]